MDHAFFEHVSTLRTSTGITAMVLPCCRYGGGDWNIVDARHVCAHITGPNRLAPLLWRYARVAPRPPAYSTNAIPQLPPNAALPTLHAASHPRAGLPITPGHHAPGGHTDPASHPVLPAAWSHTGRHTNHAVITHGMYTDRGAGSEALGHVEQDRGAMAWHLVEQHGSDAARGRLLGRRRDQSWRGAGDSHADRLGRRCERDELMHTGRPLECQRRKQLV